MLESNGAFFRPDSVMFSVNQETVKVILSFFITPRKQEGEWCDEVSRYLRSCEASESGLSGFTVALCRALFPETCVSPRFLRRVGVWKLKWDLKHNNINQHENTHCRVAADRLGEGQIFIFCCKERGDNDSGAFYLTFVDLVKLWIILSLILILIIGVIFTSIKNLKSSSIVS